MWGACPLSLYNRRPALTRHVSTKSIAARRLSACVCSIDPRTSGTCGANHEGATTAHPVNWKMKAKIFFCASHGLIGATRLCKILGPPLHKILYPPLSVTTLLQPDYFKSRGYGPVRSMLQSVSICLFPVKDKLSQCQTSSWIM